MYRSFELDPTSGTARLGWMEGVRGLAVTLVFLVHFANFFDHIAAPPNLYFAILQNLADIGHSGVDLFFVLSGYLIYGAVIRKPVKYRDFMRRRVIRIYPAFLAVTAIYLGLSLLIPSRSKIPNHLFDAIIYILENIFLLPGIVRNLEAMNTVAWSLSYEFFFYLLIPLIVSATGMRNWQRKNRILFFGLVGTGIVLLCLTNVFSLYHPRMVMFIAGIFLYEIVNSGYKFSWAGKKLDYLGLAIFPVTLIGYRLWHQQWFNATHILFIGFFIFIFACFQSEGILRQIFTCRPLRWLGNISYSYYLIHSLTIHLVIGLVAKLPSGFITPGILFWVVFPITFVLTTIPAIGLFLLVEKPYSLNNQTAKVHNYSQQPVGSPMRAR